MAAKTTDWRPGPTVCRCCLSEGCYKDISTEYFWMGKREVYSEMLSETLSLSIAYSTSGGPNSNSRLICEPCISRLRDASDFKRQVQECEKTFMQYLDPGSEPLSDFDARVEVPIEQLETQVKVEAVKTEKDDASDADGFDDRADFLDDDDDDLDDQPLTRLATKIPKKESVDLLDLLDNTKPAEKRKATTKAKAGPAKKAKTKKEAVKATSSKTTKQTEKKKKGDGNTLVGIDKFKMELRNAALALISSSNALPFKSKKYQFLCFYCEKSCRDISELEYHNATEHQVTEKQIIDSLIKLDRNQNVKLNYTNFACKLCPYVAKNYKMLKDHLRFNHGKKLDLKYDGVFPYQMDSEGFKCVLCPQSFPNYRSLNLHMNIHFSNFICEQCGVGFATEMRLKSHAQCHAKGSHKCALCDTELNTISSLKHHVERVHMRLKKNKCPHCDETFRHYSSKIYHMVKVHGAKVPEYKCTMCPKVYLVSGKLRIHERNAHFDMSRNECDVCQKKFIDSYALKDHLISHTGERNFECQVCKKKYSRKKTLAAHMRIHNYRRYVCQYCGIAFVQKLSLDSHLKSQHNKIEIIIDSDDE